MTSNKQVYVLQRSILDSENKVLEKNQLKAAYVYTYIFFPNFFFHTLSHVELIDDKFHYGIVD